MTENQCVFKQCNSQQQAIDLILNEFDKSGLKPCPFCGDYPFIGIIKVWCIHPDCSICGKPMKIEAWNRRHDAK